MFLFYYDSVLCVSELMSLNVDRRIKQPEGGFQRRVSLSQVIFRYALALLKYKEDDILKIHDSVEIYQYLRFFTKTISDSR